MPTGDPICRQCGAYLNTAGECSSDAHHKQQRRRFHGGAFPIHVDWSLCPGCAKKGERVEQQNAKPGDEHWHCVYCLAAWGRDAHGTYHHTGEAVRALMGLNPKPALPELPNVVSLPAPADSDRRLGFSVEQPMPPKGKLTRVEAAGILREYPDADLSHFDIEDDGDADEIAQRVGLDAVKKLAERAGFEVVEFPSGLLANPEAVEDSSSSQGPLPNTVVTRCDLFSGALDALVYDARTRFHNDSCLILTPGSIDATYQIGLCGKRHLHLHVGLAIEMGQMAVITTAAYALVLAYDREHWAAGFVPDAKKASEALGDCIVVLRERTHHDFTEYLLQHASRQLHGWIDALKKAAVVLEPGTVMKCPDEA